jgi:recombination protein RecA
MAKKIVVDTDDSSTVALKAIKKKYGDIIKSGSDLFDRQKDLKCISVSPAFDLALNGGIQEGSWTIISGNPKCGKSTMTLQLIANAQKDGRLAIYVDAESRLKNHYLDGINGLDKSKLTIISNDSGETALAAEDFLNTVDVLIRTPQYHGCVCVIDSTSSMLPRAEMDADVSGTLRANMPKMLSHWIKKNAQIVAKNKICMVLITHYITNTSGYGKVKVPDGGVMIQYQADNKIDFGKVEAWEEGSKKIGQKVECEISCSAMGASGNSLTTFIKYGHGIDCTKEAISLGESFGLIEKAGAWFTLPFLANSELSSDAEKKFQGGQAVYDYVSTTPAALAALNAEIQSLLST